ncbi:MAG: hypothetical protein D6818_01920, partial [Bacteroidetes bacterium]
MRSCCILLIGLWVCIGRADAHRPELSSTLLVEQAEGLWVLQVRGALAAFDYEVRARHGDTAYASIDQFEALVREDLRTHIRLTANDTARATLTDARVRPGHETVVTFRVRGLPDHIESLQLANTFFADIARSQNLLIVHEKEQAPARFVLQADNAFAIALTRTADGYVPAADDRPLPLSDGTLAWLLGSLIAGLLIAAAWPRLGRRT